MKKSYNYFKMLNELSNDVSKAFSDVLNNKNIEFNRMAFFSSKKELNHHLCNEFMTPISRDDIYIIADCLTEQMHCIRVISEFSSLFWYDVRKTNGLLADILKRQEKLLSSLWDFKNKKQVLNECSESLSVTSNTSFYIQKKIKDCISGVEQQPLLRYTIYASLFEFSQTLKTTFSQIERILINS